MAKLPEPPAPAELAARTAPEIRTLPAQTLLWRVYFRGGPHPATWSRFRAFGPVASGRFDHHDPPPRAHEDRAILYAAIEGPTCLAEAFQDTRVIDRRRHEPWLAAFATTSPLALLDLTTRWPTRAGASTSIHSGPRPRAQCWARAIHAAYPELHGIAYCSSMDASRPAIALFERARSAVPAYPRLHRSLADPPLLVPIANAAERLGYRVV